MDYFRAKRFLDTLPDWETGTPPSGPLADYLPRMRALLARLDHPQHTFHTLIVGGTNGKGTVSSLVASLAQHTGRRVGLYTSPHLHTQRERIRVNGEILDKDDWAKAVSALYDATRDFEREELGVFSKFEALTALAAHFFSKSQVEWAVFEVGLGGRYDATNAWDSRAAILTRVGLDHVGTLGHTIEEIAADKVHIARSGCPLFTTASQTPGVTKLLQNTCDKRDIALHTAPVFPHHARTAHYAENAGLALTAARHLDLAPAPPSDENLIAEHVWPGRFEQASADPLVLLDGAHNPQAARELAGSLRTLRDRWTLIVGVGAGHDAQGIIEALAPLADRIILTASDHPKAVPANELAPCVPEGVASEVISSFSAALQSGQRCSAAGSPLCVAGSLFLVARAREFFNLPCERDSITEDMALENLQCLEMACTTLGLSYQSFSNEGSLIRVEHRTRPFYFWRNKHPFNDYMGARIAEDKAFQYEIFARLRLPIPHTMQVFNPLADPRFDRYKTHQNLDNIIADIEQQFAFPVVVKKYRSSLAQGVFIAHQPSALAQRLQSLFQNSAYSDNIVLIQAYVPGPEYRVVATQDQLLLAYRKEGETAGQQDLNPLHQEDGRAVRVAEGALLDSMSSLVAEIAPAVELGFYAVDLIDSSEGLRILELNPNPFCYFYNRDNGREDFSAIYRQLLEKYVL